MCIRCGSAGSRYVAETATEEEDDAPVDVLTSEELRVIVVEIIEVDDWTIDLFKHQYLDDLIYW